MYNHDIVLLVAVVALLCMIRKISGLDIRIRVEVMYVQSL
jgi:hypothetical protein